jgi:glyoxylase-like metal-dependent hydrolase (beta-lactamase superfamily II)
MSSSLAFEVRHSGIWQLSSAVLCSEGQVLLIDPGYFPRELAELSALAEARGQVSGVVFTHGHWDHVMGWRHVPSAPVYVSQPLCQAIASGSESAQKDLRDAASFDRRWYVDRGGPPAWPPPDRLRSLAEGAILPLGSTLLSALQLPGHSADGLALLAREQGLLFLGDYLSPCEIPFVSDLGAYRATLGRLLALCDQLDRIVPGHGPILRPEQARAIARADLAYLDALAELAASPNPSLTAALAIPLPRASENPDMHEHHRDNCRAAGIPL